MAAKKSAAKAAVAPPVPAEPAKPVNPIANCKPRGDRVLVRRDTVRTATASGILLPETYSDGQKKNFGTVVRTGPGNRGPDGERLPVDLAPGDRVLLTGYSGMDITDPDNPTTQDEYVILREDDILAVL